MQKYEFSESKEMTKLMAINEKLLKMQNELVTNTITRHLYEVDDELDCMSCLDQVMVIFQEELGQNEINRIAEWFEKRYRK